jgi:hypothetical protein
MKRALLLSAGALLVALGVSPRAGAADRAAPPRPPAGDRSAAARVLDLPAVQAAIAGHRIRVLRVWSELAKGRDGDVARTVVVVRDYDSGTAREIAAEIGTGRVEMRELAGVQPSAEEIEDGMSIVRRDPALARLVADPGLELVGGFHNRSSYSDDPCSRDVCLEFAFLKPDYRGPERYVVVNLSRGVVAHHDFRARPGERRPRSSERP